MSVTQHNEYLRIGSAVLALNIQGVENGCGREGRGKVEVITVTASTVTIM